MLANGLAVGLVQRLAVSLDQYIAKEGADKELCKDSATLDQLLQVCDSPYDPCSQFVLCLASMPRTLQGGERREQAPRGGGGGGRRGVAPHFLLYSAVMLINACSASLCNCE